MPNDLDSQERAELDLIAADVRDAAGAFLSAQGHPDQALIAFASFPAATFVAEEIHNYFSQRRRSARFGSIDGPLFDQFGRAVKKVRASLKLLDDNDSGPTHLVPFMEFARERSQILFTHPRNRFIQTLSRPWRPDIAVFFAREHLVATSHALLPTMGFSRDILVSAKPGEFKSLSAHAKRFSEALGEFFSTTRRVLGSLGIVVELRPIMSANCRLLTSSIEFVAAKFYRQVDLALSNAERSKQSALTVCLAQTNQALHVLPRLLGADSGLLRRIQFLTAHHGSNCVRNAVGDAAPNWLANRSDLIMAKPLRNMMAHYGLRGAAKFVVGSQSPFQAAVQGIAAAPSDEAFRDVEVRLAELSVYLGAGLTRARLWRHRATLGTHSECPA